MGVEAPVVVSAAPSVTAFPPRAAQVMTPVEVTSAQSPDMVNPPNDPAELNWICPTVPPGDPPPLALRVQLMAVVLLQVPLSVTFVPAMMFTEPMVPEPPPSASPSISAGAKRNRRLRTSDSRQCATASAAKNPALAMRASRACGIRSRLRPCGSTATSAHENAARSGFLSLDMMIFMVSAPLPRPSPAAGRASRLSRWKTS